jgi:uncharacterized membrane protein
LAKNRQQSNPTLNQPNTQKTETRIISQQRIAPIPHYSELQGYESVKAGFAGRIIVMAEKEQDARIQKESKLIAIQDYDIKEYHEGQKHGRWFAFSSIILLV